MKTLITLSAVAAALLSGCAYDAPAYANRGAYPAQSGDPSQWHVVSVTPVAPGTAARVAASAPGGATTGYTSTPLVSQPVYVQQPVYYPAPVYYAPAPYYYPPVSIGLDFGFGFGRGWGGHRGWGGVGVGHRWGR